MKTLTEAIEILEDYLHFSHNVDPLFQDQIGVSRIYHWEKEHFWQLVQCRKGKVNSHDIEPSIGGAYIVDKQDGKIYMIGSSPVYDWEMEFTKFKMQQNSQIDWIPFRNEYQECKLANQKQHLYQHEYFECHVDERESKIKEFVNAKFQKGLETCLIKFKPFEMEIGQVEIRTPIKPLDSEISVVSKLFNGSLANSSKTLNQLRKYIRINKLKLTDNYWIEINQTQKDKSYIEWQFEYKLEYKKNKSSR